MKRAVTMAARALRRHRRAHGPETLETSDFPQLFAILGDLMARRGGCLCATRQVSPRIARELALARKRVQRRRPREFGQTSGAVRSKTQKSRADAHSARANRAARAILEPRAPSH